MTYPPVLLYLLLAVCIVFAATFFIHKTSGQLFRSELLTTSRFDTLDGLRGLAATSVAIHHSFFFFGYASSGKWSIDYLGRGELQVIIDYLGKGSVSLFFMITAFLFWGKVLGVSDAMNWRGFYIKRFFRIVPLYLVVVAISLIYVIATIKTPFTFFPYIRDMFYWLTFDFFGTPNINGFPLSKSIVAGVFWTLSYEWMFYFLLPVISVFAVSRNHSMFIILTMFAISMFIFAFGIGINLWAQTHVLCFIIGAACAHLCKYYPGFCGLLKSPLFTVFALCAVVFCLLVSDAPYSHFSTMFIGFLFLVISSGNSFFGVLKTNTLKLLGVFSFSIYLLHGLTYTIIFSPMIRGGITFPLALAITLVVIIILSAVSYILIERPFIFKGRTIVGDEGGNTP